MDVCLVIKRRLGELGLEQKDLAVAAEVTESYVSQLLARKKLPPAPERTDIYQKMAKFLKLPSDRLSKLAELQRVDAELAQLERMIESGNSSVGGQCPACNAVYAHGAAFCAQCASPLIT